MYNIKFLPIYFNPISCLHESNPTKTKVHILTFTLLDSPPHFVAHGSLDEHCSKRTLPLYYVVIVTMKSETEPVSMYQQILLHNILREVLYVILQIRHLDFTHFFYFCLYYLYFLRIYVVVTKNQHVTET